MKRLLLACAVVLATALPAVAQTQGGSISGVVRDQQHAVVPGADVSAQGSDATYHFTTDLDGAFRFLSLQPGTYKITVTLSGFRTAMRDVIVAVGRSVDAPMELHVAPVVEVLTVSAPAPILDRTATAHRASVYFDQIIDQRVIPKYLGRPLFGDPRDLRVGKPRANSGKRRQGVNDIADRAQFYDENLQAI